MFCAGTRQEVLARYTSYADSRLNVFLFNVYVVKITEKMTISYSLSAVRLSISKSLPI